MMGAEVVDEIRNFFHFEKTGTVPLKDFITLNPIKTSYRRKV
jgi:hypothetical protein